VNVWGDSVGCGVVAHLSEMTPSVIKNQLLCCCGKKNKRNHVTDASGVDASRQNEAYTEAEEESVSKAETNF
jgi:hypothetical protein